ncbi:unnamed protein product [Tenebrio molitor]|nr:unnamed protein product [Tenebrio molitor]
MSTEMFVLLAILVRRSTTWNDCVTFLSLLHSSNADRMLLPFL